MSMYLRKATCMNDSKVLKKVLEKRFAEVEHHSTPQPLVGYQGDYRTEDGEGHTTDAGKALKAELIVRKKHVGSAANDIGFRKDSSGNFETVISQYDSNKHGEKWLQELTKDYLVEKAKSLMNEQDAEFLTQEPTSDGGIKLTFRAPAYA